MSGALLGAGFGTLLTALTTTPANMLPAITATPASFAVGAAAGSTVSTLSAVPAGATRTVAPADGKVVLASGGGLLVVGATASVAGTINYTITDTLAGATNSPVSLMVSVTATSVTLPTITATAASFTVGAAAGTVISNLSALPANAVRAVTPADNKVVLASGGGSLVVGLTASTVGTISYTITDTLTGATNSPQSLVVPVTVDVAPAAGASITTLSVANAGAAPVTNALAQRVIGFARGDVPGAQAGNVRLTVGGTHRQHDAESYYSDGSLKVAVVTVPSGALAAGASTAALPVSYEALAPNRTAVVTTAQVIANSNFRLQIAGGELGADVFEISVNDIFTSGSQFGAVTNVTRAWRETARGPSRCGWHLYGLFTRVGDGAFHRWLTADIYLDALSATEFTVRARVIQPFVFGAHPSGTVGGLDQPRHVFYAELKNGATLVQAWGGPNDTRIQDVPATAFGLDQWLTLAPTGFGLQAPYMLSAPAGTLPAGLSTTEPVFPIWENSNTRARLFDSRYGSNQNAQNFAAPWVSGEGIDGFGSATANQQPVIRIANNGIYVPRTSTGVTAAGTTAVAPSGATFADGTLNWTRLNAGPITAAGTGTIRMTPMLFTMQALAVELVSMTTSERVRIGGTDHGCVIVPDMWYQAQKALVHVPFASQAVPPAVPSRTYFPGAVHQVWGQSLSTTGSGNGDERIGYISSIGGVALMRPTDLDSRKTALVLGNSWSAFVLNVRDHASGLIPTANNGPNKAGALYAPGMPLRTAMALPPLQSGGVISGSTTLMNVNGYDPTYGLWIDGSHMPRSFLTPYLLTGDAAYMTAMAGQFGTNLTAWNQGGVPITVGTVNYYRVDSQRPQEQVRSNGWTLSLIGDTNHLIPAAWIESAYIKDVYNENATYCAALYPTLSPIRKALGFWTVRGDTAGAQTWMEHFCGDTRGIEALRGDHPGWRDVYENFHLRLLLDRIDPSKGGCDYWAGVRTIYMATPLDNDAGWIENNWGALWPAAFIRMPTEFDENGGPIPASFTCPATGLFDEYGTMGGNSINRLAYFSAIIATRLGVVGADALRQSLRTRLISKTGTSNDYVPTHVQYPSYFFEYEPINPNAPVVPAITAGQTFAAATGAAAGTVIGTVLATGSPTSWAITAGNTGTQLAISAAGVITAAVTLTAATLTLTVTATNTAGTGTGSVGVTVATVVAPAITAGQTFSAGVGTTAGTVIGTVTASGSPTSWAITSGNTGTQLAISAAGVITAAVTLTANTFTLGLSATNAGGTGAGSVTVTVSGVASPALILNSMPGTGVRGFYSTMKAGSVVGPSLKAFRGAENAAVGTGTTADIPFTNGVLDQGLLGTFANGVQVFVETLYDQGGLTQPLTFSDSTGRPALTSATGVPLIHTGSTGNRVAMRFLGQGRGLNNGAFTTGGTQDFGVLAAITPILDSTSVGIAEARRIVSLAASLTANDYDVSSSFYFTEAGADSLAIGQSFSATAHGTPVLTVGTAGVAGFRSTSTYRRTSWNGVSNAGGVGLGALSATGAIRVGYQNGGYSTGSASMDLSALMLFQASTDAELASMVSWMRSNLGI